MLIAIARLGAKHVIQISQVFDLQIPFNSRALFTKNIIDMAARTRSAQKVTTEVKKTVVSVKDEKITKVKTKMTKVTKVKANGKAAKPAKLTFEDAIEHIVVPENLELPAEFVSFHSPEFITGVQHVLKEDPSLYRAIVQSNFGAFEKDASDALSGQDLIQSHWLSLVSSVISQQVSGAAAKSIKGKFIALLDGDVSPQNTLSKSYEELRSVGLSNSKVKYVTHISESYADKDNKLTHPEFYTESSLQEIYEEFVKLKGIGLWSAKMFAIFTLKELDVFAHEDLGVARGIARYFEKRPSLIKSIKEETKENELLKKRSTFDKPAGSSSSKRDWVPYHDEYVKYAASRYSPYRSVFMLLMWRLSATNVEALSKETVKEE